MDNSGDGLAWDAVGSMGWGIHSMKFIPENPRLPLDVPGSVQGQVGHSEQPGMVGDEILEGILKGLESAPISECLKIGMSCQAFATSPGKGRNRGKPLVGSS